MARRCRQVTQILQPGHFLFSKPKFLKFLKTSFPSVDVLKFRFEVEIKKIFKRNNKNRSGIFKVAIKNEEIKGWLWGFLIFSSHRFLFIFRGVQIGFQRYLLTLIYFYFIYWKQTRAAHVITTIPCAFEW